MADIGENKVSANNAELTKQQIKNKKKREAAKLKKKEKQSQDDQKDSTIKPQNQEEVLVVASEDNFEEELCWCIKQLELGLQNQKPSKEQAQKTTKIINQFKSNKIPKPKKRMLMKQTFGDYREKISKQNKAMSNVKPAHLVTVDQDILNKSQFIRKKVNDLPEQLRSNEKTDDKFSFNFPDPT